MPIRRTEGQNLEHVMGLRKDQCQRPHPRCRETSRSKAEPGYVQAIQKAKVVGSHLPFLAKVVGVYFSKIQHKSYLPTAALRLQLLSRARFQEHTYTVEMREGFLKIMSIQKFLDNGINSDIIIA